MSRKYFPPVGQESAFSHEGSTDLENAKSVTGFQEGSSSGFGDVSLKIEDRKRCGVFGCHVLHLGFEGVEEREFLSSR